MRTINTIPGHISHIEYQIQFVLRNDQRMALTYERSTFRIHVSEYNIELANDAHDLHEPIYKVIREITPTTTDIRQTLKHI
jgi:hypothetical protein